MALDYHRQSAADSWLFRCRLARFRALPWSVGAGAVEPAVFRRLTPPRFATDQGWNPRSDKAPVPSPISSRLRAPVVLALPKQAGPPRRCLKGDRRTIFTVEASRPGSEAADAFANSPDRCIYNLRTI